jgi:hypothetical protein
MMRTMGIAMAHTAFSGDAADALIAYITNATSTETVAPVSDPTKPVESGLPPELESIGFDPENVDLNRFKANDGGRLVDFFGGKVHDG